MIDQVDTENTDMGTYLGRIGSSLTKEGHSLQALARMWGEDNQNIVSAFGADIIDLGEQLLELRKRLCKKCKLQEVKVILSFNDFPEEGNESQVDVPSD